MPAAAAGVASAGSLAGSAPAGGPGSVTGPTLDAGLVPFTGAVAGGSLGAAVTAGAAVKPLATRVIQAPGSLISLMVGIVAGDSQTLLKPSMPIWSTTARTKRAPSAYWRIFRSMPSSRRMACSTRPAVRRLVLNRSLISATDGTTWGPTASIT